MNNESIFSRVTSQLKQNKEIRESGKFLNIPWLNLPKLSTVLPGIQKGRYIIVTANQKVGKTQLADYLYLYEPLDFIFKNPETSIKLKIFYFSLEMSKEDKILQMISNKIYRDTKKIISTDNLQSYFKGYILEDEIFNLISTYESYFKKVEETVTFIDNIRNGYGIYKEVRKFARENGKFYRKDGTLIENIEKDTLYEYYVPNDPDLHVICITDHISLLQPQVVDGHKESLWETMFSFSSKYCINMRDNFKYTIVNIQQQAADQEKQQFTFKGDSIIDKIRPSPDGLGDCKITSRDCDLMLSLFSPARYSIIKYPESNGYDISKLKDNYRELSILLNRRGGGSINLDLYFNGAVNYFEELPSAKDYKYLT